jgi:hypothetical protein
VPRLPARLGFLPRREADALAAGHRELTRDVSVKLRTA